MAAGVFGDRVEQFIAKGACELRGDSVRRLRIGVEEIDLGSGGDNAGIRGREGANGHDSVPRSKLPPWVGRLCTRNKSKYCKRLVLPVGRIGVVRAIIGHDGIFTPLRRSCAPIPRPARGHRRIVDGNAPSACQQVNGNRLMKFRGPAAVSCDVNGEGQGDWTPTARLPCCCRSMAGPARASRTSR